MKPLFLALLLVAAFLQSSQAQGAGPAPLFRSQLLKSGDTQRLIPIEVALKKRDLYLIVSSEGNGSHDWANWIEPELVMKDGTNIDLTTLAWRTAFSTVGQIQRGKTYRGGPMKVAGKEYTQGLGTHADSFIWFKVPKGATSFRARIALDDGGAIRDGEQTPASVRFLVFDREPVGFARAPDKFNPNSLDPQSLPADRLAAPDDLEVTVWATSPMFYNPTNMDTDSVGRIWVAEGVNYRKNRNRRPEGDRIVVLEDKDHDGKADSSHVFVQDPELVAPLGLSVFGNRIVVAQPPHLIVYTDVDGDLKYDPKVDRRENILSGFNGKNHDHSLHAVVSGPDGKWYFNQGNCGAHVKTRDGDEFLVGGPYNGGEDRIADSGAIAGRQSSDGHVWVGGFAARMNPDGTQVQVIGHGFRNSYEHTVTSFGDVFQNDNDDPPACRTTWLMEGGFLGFFSPDGKRGWRADQRPGQTIQEAQWRQWDPGVLPAGDVYGGGSPTGICFYENGALPSQYNGLLLSGEAGRKVVFGYYPELKGSSFGLERFDFFKSKGSNLFRPSDVMVGADGALYVADWFDSGVGGHNDRDQSCSGTIYRIAPKGFQPRIAQADPGTLEDAITLLCSPATNVRFVGLQTLKAAGANAIPAVRELLHHKNEYVRARAVWLLPLLGHEGLEIVNSMLIESPEAQTRLLAFRALRNAGQDVALLVSKLHAEEEPNAAVRREMALALRDVPAERKQVYLSSLLRQCESGDRTYLEACGIGAHGADTDKLWRDVKQGANIQDPSAWTDAFARITWRLRPSAAIKDLVDRATETALTLEARLLAIETLAFYDDPRALNALLEVATTPGPVGGEATRWLIHLGNTRWRKLKVFNSLKQRGIYDPAKIEIIETVIPAVEEESKLPPVADILALKGDAKKGKVAAARCVMCHRLERMGVDYGPSLLGWIRNQGDEKFVQAVVDPSAEIAHGYSGSRVRLKDGKEVHGLTLSTRNPLIVQSQGGAVQVIPSSRIDKVEPLGRSLMLSADQLGLSAQEVADVLAYMKSLDQEDAGPGPKIDPDVAKTIGTTEPFFERWDEGGLGLHGTLAVAMDGTVLMFGRGGGKDIHEIFLQRSEDGGATWSDRQQIGKSIEMDWKALGIGPYNGKGWGNDKHFAFASLGTSVVDETTGEIMLFMTALHPVPYMYKSRDHGKTWTLEKIVLHKDSRGFLPSPNPAHGPGITIKQGPHKGRLLAGSHVMPNYRKQGGDQNSYSNAVYSDDHGKTWHSSEPFPLNGTGECGLVELSDGTIYFNTRTSARKGNRWIAYSDDSGETWRDLHEDDELFDGPPDMYGCKAGLLRLDRDDCDILLFSSPDPSLPEKQNRANVNVWASFDGGKTWPVNRLIKEGPGNYSWITQGRKGTPSEGFIYVRSIEGGLARFNLAWLLQPDDKKAGKYAFAKDAPVGKNLAKIGPDSDEFVLPPRHDYRMDQKPPFVKSVKNARLFKIKEHDRLKRLEDGYRLIDTKASGHVLSRKICLPGDEMKISCDVSSGAITLSLLDADGKRIQASQPITGGFKDGEVVQWPDGFKLDDYVATPVTVQFELEGGAELYAIRFDKLFWE